MADGNPVVADYWRHRWLYSSLEVDAARNPGLMRMRQASLDLLGLKNKVWRGKIHHSFAQPTGCEVLLPRDRWQAREVGGGDLGKLLNDGDITSGFRSKGPAKNGLSVVLDLQERQKVGGLAIIPDDFRHVPKGLRIEIAGSDGKFKTIREAQNYWGPLYLSGPHPFLKARFPRIESYFPPQDVRYIRLTHLGDSHNVWTMQEILLFGPGLQTNFESWEKSADKIIGF